MSAQTSAKEKNKLKPGRLPELTVSVNDQTHAMAFACVFIRLCNQLLVTLRISALGSATVVADACGHALQKYAFNESHHDPARNNP
jgi:hypothetical protein